MTSETGFNQFNIEEESRQFEIRNITPIEDPSGELWAQVTGIDAEGNTITEIMPVDDAVELVQQQLTDALASIFTLHALGI